MCGISGIVSDNSDAMVKYLQLPITQWRIEVPMTKAMFIALMVVVLCAKGDDSIAACEDFISISEVDRAKVIFGHRRLSIIDIGPSGHQPMVLDNLILSYNGEIYNYLEIRRNCRGLDIHSKPIGYRSIFSSFKHWGADAFEKFNGMGCCNL